MWIARFQGFRLERKQAICVVRCALQKITFAMRCVLTAIWAIAAEIHCDVGHDASITAIAMPRRGELRTPPKTVLPPPHLWYISPPICSRPVIFLRGNGHRPDQSHCLSPPKLALEGALSSTLPYPFPKSHDTVLPPPHLSFPNHVASFKQHHISLKEFLLWAVYVVILVSSTPGVCAVRLVCTSLRERERKNT